jgi:hypothetical protein
MSEQDLRYPIGHFLAPVAVTREHLDEWIEELARLPDEMRRVVNGLSEQQLDRPYRPGGWTVRQVVHHVPDSHLNSYQRYRLALTEETPTIKAYNEAAWADLADARSAPIEPSLELVAALHKRWVSLLRSLTKEQWERTFRHPENGLMRLDTTAGLYAWHSRHHIAHIRKLREREGW